MRVKGPDVKTMKGSSSQTRTTRFQNQDKLDWETRKGAICKPHDEADRATVAAEMSSGCGCDIHVFVSGCAAPEVRVVRHEGWSERSRSVQLILV